MVEEGGGLLLLLLLLLLLFHDGMREGLIRIDDESNEDGDVRE